MSDWTIGKEAREALTKIVKSAKPSQARNQLRRFLDDCTDADEGGRANSTATVQYDLSPAQHESAIRNKLVELGWTPPDEGGQEPVKLTFPTMLRKMWSGSEVQRWLDDQPPLYTRPPVGLPAGMRVVPSYVTDEWVRRVNAITGGEHDLEALKGEIHALLFAAPPCPGVVGLPDGWPWDDEVRQCLSEQLRAASLMSLHLKYNDIANASLAIAECIESHGKERIEAAGEQGDE